MSNTVEITGNLGADCRVKVGDFGTVIGFSLAYTPRKKSGDEFVDAGPTLWFDVSAWGDVGEPHADALSKGTRVTVAGKLGSREYGGKTYMTIRADTLAIETVTPRPAGSGAGTTARDPWANVPPETEEPGW